MKKKYMIVACLVAVAGVSSADFAYNWMNVEYAISIDSTTVLNDGALIQLIWRPDNTADRTVSKAGIGGAVDASGGEILISSAFTLSPTGPPPDFGLWVDNIYVIFESTIPDVHSGYIFTRIFQDGTADFGDIYYDTEYLSSSLVYEELDVNSIETANTVTDDVEISSLGTTVIPEPATIGLMGIAGLGMFLARRKVRR